MAATPIDSPRRRAMTDWLARLNPDRPLSFTNDDPTAAPAETGPAPGGGGGGTPLKAGHEIEVMTRQITKDTKRGEIKLTASLKVAPTVIGSGSGNSPVVSSTTRTSRIKDGKRQGGVKQGFSFQDIEKLKLLDGLEITNISVGIEGEWSGTEISAYALIKFEIHTPHFKSPVNVKVILFSAKEGESVKLPGIEIKISPTTFKVKVAGVETVFHAEYKASYVVDWAKVGGEVLEKAAKKKLEQEAKKQGVKYLARKAGEKLLTRLGPLAAAFGVGWDIGTLLNKYTIADEIAGEVMDHILGDFAERYHQEDTLGKMVLVSKNLPRITAAMVTAGLVGVAAGVTDLIAFKLLNLDKLADFGRALKQFGKMLENVPKIGEVVGDMMLSTAFKLGIKLNPKYRTISDPSFDTIARAVYDRIKPVFKKRNGLNELINLHLEDIDIPEDALLKAAALIKQKKLNYGSRLDLSVSPEEIVAALLDFGIQDFLGFLESNRLIAYKIKISDELSTKSLDQSLVNEVFL